ncbi:MAG: RDD family protein [Aquihabitans sp.]
MTGYAPTYGPPADPTNVIGRRIGAWFIDLLVFIVLVVAAVLLSGTWAVDSVAVSGQTAGDNYCQEWNRTHEGACSYSNGEVTTFEFEQIYVNGAFLLNLVGYVVIQGVTGASLGKLAVGLRVIDEQGQRIGIGKSTIRTLLWVVDGIVCGLPVVGGVLIVSTKGHRRVGDMAASTYVVDKHQVGHPLAIPGVTVAWPGTPGGYGQAPGYGPAPGYGQPGGYGQAPEAWQPPAVGQQPGATPGSFPSSPPVQPAPTPPGDGPTWDVARNAYIQYDREQSAWVQWDGTSQQWLPIDQ